MFPNMNYKFAFIEIGKKKIRALKKYVYIYSFMYVVVENHILVQIFTMITQKRIMIN